MLTTTSRTHRAHQDVEDATLPAMPPLRTTADTPATGETLFAPPLGPNDMGKSDTFKKRRGPVSCAGTYSPPRVHGAQPEEGVECRRLKLKCDRRLPCSTCSKRGCAAICPNGTPVGLLYNCTSVPTNLQAPLLQAPANGASPCVSSPQKADKHAARFVLADTEQLHEKISQVC